MFRYIAIAALVVMTACTPTTRITVIDGFPEHVGTARCYTGGEVLSLVVRPPTNEGQVYALTQFSNLNGQLAPVCRLNSSGDMRLGFPIYSGEVYGGNAGLCVSARMSSGNHLLSCASAEEIRSAMSQPLGAPGNTIRLTRWTPYPGS